MPTLVLDPPPPELQALIDRRRRAGLDRLDEVWEGVLHMIAAPSFEHARITQQLAVLLDGPARAAGLIPAIGEFVIPDLLGGPDTLMIGKVLWDEFFNNRDWPVAAAVAVVLVAALAVPLLAAQRFLAREHAA